jgi:hypothetical protein
MTIIITIATTITIAKMIPSLVQLRPQIQQLTPHLSALFIKRRLYSAQRMLQNKTSVLNDDDGGNLACSRATAILTSASDKPPTPASRDDIRLILAFASNT